jgi:hypothetical protein
LTSKTTIDLAIGLAFYFLAYFLGFGAYTLAGS